MKKVILSLVFGSMLVSGFVFAQGIEKGKRVDLGTMNTCLPGKSDENLSSLDRTFLNELNQYYLDDTHGYTDFDVLELTGREKTQFLIGMNSVQDNSSKTLEDAAIWVDDRHIGLGYFSFAGKSYRVFYYTAGDNGTGFVFKENGRTPIAALGDTGDEPTLCRNISIGSN